jgi:serine/threonine-protein kinase
MPPEQAIGRKEAIGPAVDVYALGAILYELLTGRPPFQGETRAETIQQLIAQDPVPPSRLNGRVPRDLETICLKCLHKEPERRYGSALALADDLNRFLGGRPIQARPVGWGERSWRWCRRNPAAAAILALVLLAAGGGLWSEWQKAERQGQARGAVEAALGQLPDLRRQARWAEAEAVFTQARSRLDDARSDDLRLRLAQADEALQIAAELERLRLTPATEAGRFDYRSMAAEYARGFEQAGLDVWGDPKAVAEHIRISDLRPQLMMALDNWAYVADALDEQKSLARLLELARRTDPDPEWGDRVRTRGLWSDHEAVRRLAAEALQRLAEGAPEHAPSTAVVTLLAKKLGRYDKQSAPLLRAAQLRHPDDFWLNYALGDALREKEPAEAASFYRAALATRPTAEAVWRGLGAALEGQGRVDEAMAHYRRAIELDPKGALAHDYLSTCLLGKGRVDEAMAECRRAIELDPKLADPHYALGLGLQGKGRLDQAMAEFRRAVELDPKRTEIHYSLGLSRAHAARREWAPAAEGYARVLKGGATDEGHFWFEYAALLVLSGDRSGYAKACTHMTKALGKTGGPRSYHVARACTLAPGAVAEASLPGRLAKKELQDSAKEFWSLTEQGALYYRAHRYQEAVPFFEKSLGAEPKLGRAVINWLWLALANQRLGKAEEARRWLSKAQAWLDQYRDGIPARADEELGLDLHNWLEAHVLRREAESLLGPR